ncbi:hypothetical protein [Amycolatopsis aidingensis]|uniref:hypothetical protein n=1 Tax=Amycolatopsis aidingensis TaxID=2842453 RepID=UPI001C0CCD26|nr:hypothetical protein [Amycolatopsis aidingensis]
MSIGVARPVAWKRLLVPGAWTIVVIGWIAALLTTGSAAGDVALWLLAIGLGVLLPGVALVRAVRPGTAPLIEDLGWGAAAGCLVAMLGWALGVVLQLSLPPWLFGPVIAGVLAAVPRTRHRVLAKPAPGWGPAANLTIAGVMLVVVGWMTVDFLRLHPVDPGPSGSTYYPDIVFQLAVVGQLRHSLVLDYPMVAGELYSYQWFLHAVLAHLLDAGVMPFDGVARLAPATLMPAVLLVAAVIAAGIARRVVAGPIAAALLGVVGTTVATWSVGGSAPAMIQTYWWASISTAFGWLVSLPVAGCAVAILRRDSSTAPTLLFLPFAALAAGAKSTNLVVLLGGALLAFAFVLIRRRPLRPAFLVLSAVGGTLLAALFTIYSAGGNGLRLDPLGRFEHLAVRLFPGLAGATDDAAALAIPDIAPIAVLTAVLLYFLPVLPRLLGFVFLARWEWRDAASWFLLGTVLAGAVGILAFRHPGQSEGFFFRSAFPVGVLASAWGLALVVERVRRLPWVRLAAAGAVAGLLLSVLVALAVPVSPLPHWEEAFGHAPSAGEMSPLRQVAHYLFPLGVLFLPLLALTVAGLLARARKVPLAIVTIGAILGTGLLSTGFYLTGAVPTYSQTSVASAAGLRITRDDIAAGNWLARHTAPEDVLATNRVCTQEQPTEQLPEPCQAKTFTLSALAGRTVEVAGWAYASRNLERAWESTERYTMQPFWAPERLRRELRAFTHPSRATLRALSEAGVRWLVADKRGAPTDRAALDRLATRRLTLETVTVWELPAR